MAQLKDSVVSGNLRVTDTTLTDVVQADTIQVNTSSSSSTKSAGTSGQVIMTDGNKAYWGTVSSTDRYVNTAAFAQDTTNNNVKMILTRSGSDSATITANIPSATTSVYGVTKLSDSISTDSSTLAASAKAVKTLADTKQNALTFDSAPTANSSNPVTSDGILTALKNQYNYPLLEKTYESYACSAANVDKGYIYFMHVYPTSDNYYSPWWIHYTLEIQGATAQCQGFYDITIGSAGTTSQYIISNKFYSTSYYPSYYHLMAWHNSQPKYANREENPIRMGERIYSAYNAVSMARTYIIKVYDTFGCTVEFPSAIETYDSFYTDAKYGYNSTWNATSQGTLDNYDANTIPYQLYEYYTNYYIHDTTTPLHRYKFCGWDSADRLVPITSTNQTAATCVEKTGTTVPMKVSKGLVYYSTTTDITTTTGVTGHGTIYKFSGVVNNPWTYNFSAVPGQNKNIYLVGTYNPETDEFTLDTSSSTSFYLFTTIGTFDSTNFITGKYYWYVGCTSNNSSYPNYGKFDLEHPLYYFNGSDLKVVTPTVQVQSDWNATSGMGVILNKPTIPSITLNGTSTTSPSFYAPVGAGTAGQVLTSNGSGAPTWQTPQSSSGPWEDGSGSYSAQIPNGGADASGDYSVAEGVATIANNYASHAEGYDTTASGNCAHAEGGLFGSGLQEEDGQTAGPIASGDASHAEGYGTTASGNFSHAEGLWNTASGYGSHTEGVGTSASNQDAHAEGGFTTASGAYSHSEGYHTTAQNEAEHASGKYNSSTKTNTTFGNAGNTHFSIGIGTGNNAKSNALEIMQNGDMYVKGVGSYTGTYASSGIKSLQTVIEEKATAATTLAGYGITDATINTDGTIVLGNTSISVPIISTNVVSDKNNDTKTSSPKSVYSEIHPTKGTSQPSGGMLPNVWYDLGTLSSNTTFSVASPSDSNITNHYFWTFDTGSSAPTITWPSTITSWYGGNAPTISANKHYEVSLLDGVAICMEV